MKLYNFIVLNIFLYIYLVSSIDNIAPNGYYWNSQINYVTQNCDSNFISASAQIEANSQQTGCVSPYNNSQLLYTVSANLDSSNSFSSDSFINLIPSTTYTIYQ